MALTPDVVLVDVNMPILNGLDTIVFGGAYDSAHPEAESSVQIRSTLKPARPYESLRKRIPLVACRILQAFILAFTNLQHGTLIPFTNC